MLGCNIHFKKRPRPSACYVATTSSINFQDGLDAMLQQPVQSTSKTLWMLCCNIRFKHLPRRSTSMWTNFQDALDATLQRPFLVTSKTLWMLDCNIHFRATSKTRWMLHCNFRWTRGCFFWGQCPGPLKQGNATSHPPNPCPQAPTKCPLVPRLNPKKLNDLLSDPGPPPNKCPQVPPKCPLSPD